MGLTSDDAVSVISVVKTEGTFVEHETTAYVIDVIREFVEPNIVSRGVTTTEVVRPGGTVVNVGAGPVLPENPFEGQIWIRT